MFGTPITAGKAGIIGLLIAAMGAVIPRDYGRLLSADEGADGEMAFPAVDWVTAPPEAMGVDGAQLGAAVEWLDASLLPAGERALVVVRRGRLILADGPVDQLRGVKSVTKIFTSTVMGLLVDAGECDLETPAASCLPELGECYRGVKLRHFVTMTSGYRAVGDEPRGTYTHGPSRTPLVPNREPLFVPPGSRFAYWDSAMNQFSHVLTEVAGESLCDRFNREIAGPIGMLASGWRWGELGVTGRGIAINGGAGNLGGEVEISALDLARIGHLFLNGGRWNGNQLLSGDWIDEATRVQVGPKVAYAEARPNWKGSGAYGFNWWVNGLDSRGKRRLPGAPLRTFFASGYQSRCFVIPEWEMVVVCLGADLPGGDGRWGGFLSEVKKAMGR